MRHHPTLLAALAAAWPLLVSPAAAQDANDATAEPDVVLLVEDEVLVEADAPYLPRTAATATKSEQPLERLPLSISVVSHEMLRDQNNLVLGDALHNVPGVNAQSNAGVHDFFFLRGFDSLSSGLVMSDGVPEPEAPFYQLYNVDRVEVVRGPAGFLYGGNPLAGAVNLVPKRPVAEPFLRLGVAFGSHETTHDTVDANWTWNDGRAGLRVNGLYNASDGWRDGKESEVAGVSPILSFAAGDATIVTVAAEALQSDFTPDSGIPLLLPDNVLADVPAETAYETSSDFSEQDVTRLRVEVDHRFSDTVTLRNKTYYNRLDWRTEGTILGGAIPVDLGGGFVTRLVPRFRNRLDDEQDFLGNQTDVAVRFTTGGVRHDLVAGLELARYDDEFTLDVGLLDPAPLSGDTGAPANPFFLPQLGLRADARSEVVAPYVLDTLRLGERVDVHLGARVDFLDFSDAVTGVDTSDEHVSPFLGVSFAATEELNLYVSYAEAFSPPSTLVAGDGRAPEEGRQVEVGAKARLGERLRAAIAVYDLVKDNVAIPDASGITRQLGEQASRGVEVELAGEAPAELRWILTYAYTDAELERFAESVQVSLFPPQFFTIDRSGNRPPFSPEHLASLWVSRRFPGGLGVAVGARYVGEQAIAADNAYTIDDHAILDASLSYRFSRFTAWLDLDNLTDEEHYGRGFGSASVLPMDGFHLMGGLRFEL